MAEKVKETSRSAWQIRFGAALIEDDKTYHFAVMAPSKSDDDFVTTLYDDDIVDEEEEIAVSEDEAPEPQTNGKKRKRDTAQKKSKKRQKGGQDEGEEAPVADGLNKAADMDPDFEFQLDDMAQLEDFDGWMNNKHQAEKSGRDIDEIVASRKSASKSEKAEEDGEEEEVEFDGLGDDDEDDEMLAEDAFGMGAAPEDEDDEEDDGDSEDDDDEAESDEEDDDEEVAKPRPHPLDMVPGDESSDEEVEDEVEVERRNAFFAPESNIKGDKAPLKEGEGSFLEMSLSRPILKGLSSTGFSAPTPIQHRAIPVALMGKDIVGSAVTGSGKTGAFIIPILERLFYRSREAPTTRVVVLLPTRELALQCYNVATKLASFTDITFGQAIGGMNQREQEKILKQRPDIVIATPGRFIDFMRNWNCLTLDTVEIMVLDEADRMLEDGFADELNEILTTLPKSRQTMLFSATMTSSVDDLIRVGLSRPVRVMVDSARQTVSGLTQEFVRLRPGREDHRLAYLITLCKTSYRSRTIIFFRQKALAHRVRVLFALLDLPAAELHGSMSQDQRIAAIDNFRSGKAAYLLATDLASRGLDIKNVEAVINFEAPQSHEIYLHRVGRTARAGKTGRSCTLSAEQDRKVVKAAVKAARSQGAIIKSRQIAAEEADKWHDKIMYMQDEIEAVLREEKEEKVLATTEMQMRRTENIMNHEKDILSRPKKTWFQSEAEKTAARVKGKTALNGPGAADTAEAGPKKTKKKLSGKEKKKLMDRDERKEGRMWKKGKEDRGKSLDKTSIAKGKGASKTAPKSGPRGKGKPRGGKR